MYWLSEPTMAAPLHQSRWSENRTNVEKNTEEKDVRDSSTFSDNCCDSGIEREESFFLFQVSGIEILQAAVGQELNPDINNTA